ncbi:MAG: hypothetical protein AABX79_00935 [Nanoarchaeota archaeon]
MNSIQYLEKEKKDHAKIFYEILELEKVIDKNDLDYNNLVDIFYKILDLLSQHKKHEESLLNEINKGNNEANISKDMILIDPRRISGHIRVIIGAIRSKDKDHIKIALDNDGRMFISKVKEQIFKEEMILDNLLFLHLVN